MIHSNNIQTLEKMVVIIKKPEVSHYSSADHLGFHEGSLVICTKHQGIIDSPLMIAAYTDAVTRESAIYKWMRRSDFTKKKMDTDHERNKTFAGMGRIVRAHTKDFDPSVRDAADHVNNLLKNYGSVTQLDYDAETVAIDSILDRLSSNDYQQAVVLLGIQPWVNKLSVLNKQFKVYVDNAAEEQLSKPDITPRAARRASDEMLRPITSRIEALININGLQTYAAFVEEFNLLVKHYNQLVNEHYGRLHVRTDISPAIIDEIPPQAATGLPVYVIPVLRLRLTNSDGIEEVTVLNFSVDFTVAYKNNVLPGTATLIAQGIRKYKGEIVTTFNIR
jgi:hypothetical protein